MKAKPTTIRFEKSVLKALRDEAKKREVSLAYVIAEKVNWGMNPMERRIATAFQAPAQMTGLTTW